METNSARCRLLDDLEIAIDEETERNRQQLVETSTRYNRNGFRITEQHRRRRRRSDEEDEEEEDFQYDTPQFQCVMTSSNEVYPSTSSGGTDVVLSNGNSSIQTGPKKKKYQQHQGRNRFGCGGRLVCSRSHGAFIVTVTLMVLTLTLYFVFDAPFLWEYSPAFPIIAAVISLSVISNFVATSFTDPGILPRVDNIEVIEIDRQMAEEHNPNNDPAIQRPRFRDVIINGERVKMKYCTTCRLYRPPRCSHCAICDNCVLMFDHHCPWVGNCIGLRNYGYFYRFVFCLSILIIYLFSCSVAHVSLLSQNMPFGEVMRKTPGSPAVILICFFTTWSIIGLSCFHTYLLCADLTTNEDLKGLYRKKTRPSGQQVNPGAQTENHEPKNPFYRGCLKSFVRRLFKSPFPSVLDASGYINEHPTVVVQVPKLPETSN